MPLTLTGQISRPGHHEGGAERAPAVEYAVFEMPGSFMDGENV